MLCSHFEQHFIAAVIRIYLRSEFLGRWTSTAICLHWGIIEYLMYLFVFVLENNRINGSVYSHRFRTENKCLCCHTCLCQLWTFQWVVTTIKWIGNANKWHIGYGVFLLLLLFVSILRKLFLDDFLEIGRLQMNYSFDRRQATNHDHNKLSCSLSLAYLGYIIFRAIHVYLKILYGSAARARDILMHMR